MHSVLEGCRKGRPKLKLFCHRGRIVVLVDKTHSGFCFFEAVTLEARLLQAVLILREVADEDG